MYTVIKGIYNIITSLQRWIRYNMPPIADKYYGKTVEFLYPEGYLEKRYAEKEKKVNNTHKIGKRDIETGRYFEYGQPYLLEYLHTDMIKEKKIKILDNKANNKKNIS